MKTYEKVEEGAEWFLKVSDPGTTGERVVYFTLFADEAAIDTYLSTVISTLSTQQTNLTTQASDLGTEIAAIELLLG